MNRSIHPFILIVILLMPFSSQGQETSLWPPVSLKPLVKGLSRPTSITHAGDASGRIFVTEQEGIVRAVLGNNLQEDPFLDIAGKVGCCGERGLLSIAFPPGTGVKDHFFISYTDRQGSSVIARYKTTPDGKSALPESEKILLMVDQPYANHNGGQIAFGPDGFLYIGFGDGGSAGDPRGNGQNGSSLLGKILRLDVSSSEVPYRVPPDNPFMNNPRYRPEIWALGLRNPWRFSFDRKNGDLYIADVGQDRYEEIDYHSASEHPGKNYGWNIMEASHCLRSARCSSEGFTGPVAEYNHDEGCSVTGGFVYRGKRFRVLDGIYFFGDYCSGRIWGLRRTGSNWQKKLLLDSDLAISTFGEDENGEIYITDYRTGALYILIETSRPEKQ